VDWGDVTSATYILEILQNYCEQKFSEAVTFVHLIITVKAKRGVGKIMKPIKETRLLRPIDANFQLTEPDWTDDANINFYIPVNFVPAEYFECFAENTIPDDDWINVYLNYNSVSDKISLEIIYRHTSGYDDGNDDFDISVELSGENESYIRGRLFANKEFIAELHNVECCA
jgi:hypothetical protein